MKENIKTEELFKKVEEVEINLPKELKKEIINEYKSYFHLLG